MKPLRRTVTACVVVAVAACSLGAAREAGAEAKHAVREVGETMGQVLEDSAITAKVNSALHAEKDVKSRDIDVETFQGKVVIKGAVPDRAQADRAVKVAASVAGVKAVESRLTVD